MYECSGFVLQRKHSLASSRIIPKVVDFLLKETTVESVVLLSREKADDYVRISVHTKDLKKNLEA